MYTKQKDSNIPVINLDCHPKDKKKEHRRILKILMDILEDEEKEEKEENKKARL